MKLRSQNYSILFKKNNLKQFGTINKIYQINQNYYCIVNEFIKKKNISSDAEIDKLATDFFLIASPTNRISIINMDDIIYKAVILLNDDEVFFSLCNDLVEHD